MVQLITCFYNVSYNSLNSFEVYKNDKDGLDIATLCDSGKQKQVKKFVILREYLNY